MGFAGPIDELSAKHLDLQLDVKPTGGAARRRGRRCCCCVKPTAWSSASPRSPAKAAVIQFTQTINRAEEKHGVRATAISPGFVDTPMTDFAPVPKERMIRAEDCAEIVRLLLHLSPYARIPHIVLERVNA